MSKALNNIDLTAAERKEVAALLQRYLPDTEVWAYGSRVKFTAKPHSDLDMVAFASKEQSQAVANLREAFEESYLPFRVDLFVWNEVPEGFHRNIEEAWVVVQNMKKKDLPKGWKTVTVGEIAEVIGGGTPSSKADEYWGGSIPWLTPKDLSGYDFRRVKSGKRNITDSGLANSSARLLPKNTVLVTSRAPIGYVALADNEIATNQGFKSLILNDGYDPDFFYYLIKYNVPTLEAVSSGTTFKEISGKAFKQIKFNVPPLPEQKAIAHILGSLDDKIELNRRMNETLESMAQALFKSWFVDFDPVIDNALAAGNAIPDELKEKAAIRQRLDDERKSLPNDIRLLFPSEFAYTEKMGWVPKGWAPQTIDSIIEIDPAVNLSKNTVAPFVDMKALPLKGYSVAAINKKPYAGGAKFQNGDVLLARITPCLENGKTAIVDFLDSGHQVGFGSTEFIVLRGKAPIPTPFVACLSRNAEFREHCIKSMVGSSGRQRVQKDCFSKFYLSLPEKDMLLDKFFLLTEKKFEQAYRRSKQSRLLADLRDTLLPKLLSGEIRLEQAKKILEDIS